MKKVFIFEIKKLLIPLSIYFGIMTILGCTIMLFSGDLHWISFANLYGVFMMFLILGVVFLTFSYNKKRISADMTYSLPVTKRELFIGKYLATLAAIAAMAICYLLVCIIIMALAKASGQFDFYMKNQSFDQQLGN
ncbi:MAG: ABC-2 transporter permease, partial [Anaeroplasmataceae bacterium]|nr:ABC-2 transporter permease [Anaeroplasmataceae bacterium]